MFEVLRDPFWQFVVLALLALVAVVVGIIGINRPRKRLSYRVVLQQRLLSLQEELKSRVQITFDGNPVHDVHMIIVHLINSGNVPIEESDYIQPLGFSFGEAKILDSEVTETRPENMSVSIEADKSRVNIKPDVLNGGDSISMKVLLAGPAEVVVEGRIKGVGRIREIRDRLIFTLLLMVMFGVTLLPAIVLTVEVVVFKPSGLIFGFSVATSVLAIFLFFAFLDKITVFLVRTIERKTFF